MCAIRNGTFDIVKADEASAKERLVAMLHTSDRVLYTCSIYAVADFRVISILLFPPPAREDQAHGDQQQGDGWVRAWVHKMTGQLVVYVVP